MSLTKDLLYQIASDSENKKYPELRKAVLDLNRHLAVFDIARSGDDITLTFGIRQESSRGDFRLFGNKHDYYRMAMGASLEETFRSLAKADPNVEPLQASSDGGAIVLKLSYAWSPGTEPPAAAAPDTPAPAAPAAAAAKPLEPAEESKPPPRSGRRERTLALPSLDEEPERNPKYFVPAKRSPYDEAGAETSAAPPEDEAPPPPPPPPPSRRSRPSQAERAAELDKAYQDAATEGTPEALERFVEAHPEASQAAEARQRAGSLREQQAYQRARSSDSAEAYRDFLEKYPASPRVPELEARLQALSALQERAEADDRARAEADRRRAEAYEQARKLDDAMAYRVFLAAYPDAPEAEEIRQFLQEADAQEARRRADALKGDPGDTAYQEALAKGTPEALEAFLKAWPKNPRAPEARAVLDGLRRARGDAAPASGRSAPVPVLAAPYVPTPPTVNGRANDPAWQAAPPLEVPIVAGQGPRAVRVRAVHDGKSVFVLAQWSDSTRDSLYRPWTWDASSKTYRQSGQVDDGFAVALYRGRSPADACMLQGQDQEADVWIWRAFWSEISGYAIDETFRASRERIPKANPYPAESGSGQVWVRQDADAGSSAWSFVVPVEYEGNQAPSYRRTEPSGSRADVKVQGTWESGAWTVEFSRALDTRHADDTPLRERASVLASFAVYDKSEKSRHASTGLVRLEIRGR